jgi:surface protein
MSDMLKGSGLDCANYENTLIGWNSQSVTGRTLGASGLNYGSSANAARANLVKLTNDGGKGWTITGDNSSSVCNQFVTTWNLATAGSGATQLSFEVATTGTVSYTWTEVGGSATGSSTFSGNTLSITGLPSGKTIKLRISPTNFQRIYMHNVSDRNRLVDVEQWGSTAWTSMASAFSGCSNLKLTATGIPNLSSVTRMESMFQGCSKLVGTSSIGSWDVSKVTVMSSLFNNCFLFNQNIASWNTAKVFTMQNMFFNASAFNQNIGNWNTAKVTNMSGMFYGAGAFNQNIGSWNTAAVTSMNNMFNNASAFNQNIGNLTLNASVTMTDMLRSCGMDCNNYSATLIGWNSQSVTGRTLGATGLKYGPYASTDRSNLTGTKGWTITDGGQGTCTAPSVPSVQMIDFGGFIKHDVSNLDKPLNVYPNPATDLINLEFKGIAPSTFNVLVMDMSGKVIIKLDGVHAESNLYTLPLNGIVSGMYVVKLSDELGNTTINRFNIK